MRRQSFCPSTSSGSGGAEPLIVVEESTVGEEEMDRCRVESPPRCVDPDSPSLNPYLLSPWRDARKHSLPTPQCTSGITASQVYMCARAQEAFRGYGDIDMQTMIILLILLCTKYIVRINLFAAQNNRDKMIVVLDINNDQR